MGLRPWAFGLTWRVQPPVRRARSAGPRRTSRPAAERRFAARALVGQHVDESIGTGLDLTDPLPQVGKHRVIASGRLPFRVERDTRDELTGAVAHRADKRLPFPLRELVAVIDRQTGDRNRRDPEDGRVFDVRSAETLADGRAIVVASEPSQRPAIVLAGFDQVELVTALRPFFSRPQLARALAVPEAERIAMAVRIDLRLPPGDADKRIVRRHAAVVADAQDLADVRSGLLRLHRDVAIAEADVEQPGLVPRESRPVAAARRSNRAAFRDRHGVVRAAAPAARRVWSGRSAGPCVGNEDVLDVGQRRTAIPASACHRRRRWNRSDCRLTCYAGFE